MNPVEQEWMERYVYAVTRRLPKSQRQEVARELEELIGDMLGDGGTVAQRGTHDQLMAEGGTYRRFVEIRRRAEGWRIASDDAVAPAPAEHAPMPGAS